MSQKHSRRDFFSGCLHRTVPFLWLAMLSLGCKTATDKNSEEYKPDSPADPCNDFLSVSEEDLTKRKKLGYVKQSPIEDMTCNNCNYWILPKNGKPCGGCMLFKGPIEPGAYCTYWAAKQETNI